MAQTRSKLHPSSCLLLKGSGSLIGDSHRTYLVSRGNVSMANAGQGDLLSGVIGALLAAGLRPLPAALLAAWSLGTLAEESSRDRYPAGVLSHELAQLLPALWGRWTPRL